MVTTSKSVSGAGDNTSCVLDRSADAFLAQHDGSAPVADDCDDRPDSEELRTQNMWRAVILMAFDDSRYLGSMANERSEFSCAEARRFLTSDLSPWREDRDAVATLAGLPSGNFLQEKARKFLKPYLIGKPLPNNWRCPALVQELGIKLQHHNGYHGPKTAKAA